MVMSTTKISDIELPAYMYFPSKFTQSRQHGL